MLANLNFFLPLLAFSSLIFWLIPKTFPRLRAYWLIFVSLLLISIYAPIGGIYVGYLFLLGWLSSYLFARYKNFWALFLTLVLCLGPILHTRLIFDSKSIVVTLGIAFATVRTIGLIIDNYNKPGALKFTDTLLFISFFPLYTVGPVERPEAFVVDRLRNNFNFSDIVIGSTRIAKGIFIGRFIADGFLLSFTQSRFGLNGGNVDDLTVPEAWIYIAVRFLYSFLNFYAFCDVAIGASRLFGIKVLENFKAPLLAANIQDFWRRYHISMGNYITRYLFFPIVGFIRKSWATYVASILAFILFGLWHAFTLNYFLWGVFHGIALSGYHFYRAHIKNKIVLNGIAMFFFRVISTVVTVLFVAWVQAFANMKDIDTAVLLTKSMFGF